MVNPKTAALSLTLKEPRTFTKISKFSQCENRISAVQDPASVGGGQSPDSDTGNSASVLWGLNHMVIPV
jgi:hypothetical protein